jgi:hypothetical protein
MNALKQRAISVLNDESIDAESRAILRHALETNDPWLARLVRQAEAEAAESIVETFGASQTREPNGRDPSAAKVEALVERICAGGEESAAALLVLMGTLQDSTDPKALVNSAKHLAFTRCGELNAYGIVNAQLTALQRELLRGLT